MKNTSYLSVFIMFIFVFSFISCDEEDEDNGDNNSSLVLVENDTEYSNWDISLGFATEYGEDAYHINWDCSDESGERYVELELGGPVEHYDLTTGKFQETSRLAGISYWVDGITFNSPEEASITVTNVNKSKKTISGNFTFKIDEVFSNGDVHFYEVTGEFTDFPY